MKKKEMELGDFSKIELLLGLNDGDEFQINGHLQHLYKYDKKQSQIVDKEGNSIPSELLLKVINNPGLMKNHGKGVNTYQLMSSMVGKYFGLSVVFGMAAIVLFIMIKTQVSLSAFSLILMLLMMVSIAGAGVAAGFLLTKLIMNKELIL